MLEFEPGGFIIDRVTLQEKWFAKVPKLKLSLKAPRIRGFIPRSNSLIYKGDTRTGKDVVAVVLKECQGRMDDKSNLNPNQDDPILDESDWLKFAAEAASKKAAMSDIEADDIIILYVTPPAVEGHAQINWLLVTESWGLLELARQLYVYYYFCTRTCSLMPDITSSLTL